MDVDDQLLDQSRTNRGQDPRRSPSRRLLAGAVTAGLVAATATGCTFFSDKSVEVRTIKISRPGSAASQPGSVPDARGYVVARRMAAVSWKVTGCVLELLIEESQQVQAGKVLAPVDPLTAQADSQETQVDVGEACIGHVAPGMPVTAIPNPYPELEIPGEVVADIPTAERRKATVKVRIGVMGERDDRIVPEMGVRVSFLRQPGVDKADASARRGVLVPATLVLRRQDNDVV